MKQRCKYVVGTRVPAMLGVCSEECWWRVSGRDEHYNSKGMRAMRSSRLEVELEVFGQSSNVLSLYIQSVPSMLITQVFISDGLPTIPLNLHCNTPQRPDS